MFMENVHYKKIKDIKYKYELEEDLTYKFKRISNIKEFHSGYIVMCDDCIILKQGYRWDGATGINDKGLMIASAVHDALYQIIKDLKLKGKDYSKFKLFADEVFRDISLEVGNTKLKSNIVYLGVRWFGNTAIRAKSRG